MPTEYPANAEVRDYGTWVLEPGGVVGTDPLHPPDSTYLEQWTHLTGVGGGVDQVGIAYWDPIDVTTDPSPRFRIRASGQLSGGGTQAILSVDYLHPSDPFNYGNLITSTTFPYPGNSWGPTHAYAVGQIVEAEFYVPPAVQTALRDEGLVMWFSTSGSSSGDGYIGFHVHEAALLTNSASPPPLRRYPRAGATGPTRQWPRRITRRPGTY